MLLYQILLRKMPSWRSGFPCACGKPSSRRSQRHRGDCPARPSRGGLTDYSRELTVNVGLIVGGGPLNRVPHLAECHINIRASSFLEMGAITVTAIRELVSI